MFSGGKFWGFGFLLTLLLGSCAKESSSEERRREEVARQLQRLKLAEGNYFGYVELDQNKITPIELDLSATRNPVNGDESPSLSVAMKIGLFGGVTITSRTASFDFATGQLSVTFEKQAGAASAAPGSSGPTGRSALEFRGNLQEGQFKDAVLDGPNQGVRKVVLDSKGPMLMSDLPKYTYESNFKENVTAGSLSRQTLAYLEMKPLIETRPAPLTSDLPLLAGLSASFKFPGTALVPQTATDVIYDPIEAYVEFLLHDRTRMRFNNVALGKDALGLGIAVWSPYLNATGDIFDGAAQVGTATIGSSFPGLGLKETPVVAELPPRYFRGTYKTRDGTVSFPVVASLEYLNTVGTNSTEYPFATFPKFQLKYLICDGSGRPQTENTFDLVALDQMAGVGRMKVVGQNSNGALRIQYSPLWSEIVGLYTTDSSGGDTRDPQLRLKAETLPSNENRPFDCSSARVR